MARRCLDGPIGVHQAAVVWVQEGTRLPRDHYGKKPVYAALCGRALQCGCCWAVSRNHQRRRAAWECTDLYGLGTSPAGPSAQMLSDSLGKPQGALKNPSSRPGTQALLGGHRTVTMKVY
jgi:hypothetical protein